MSRQRSEPKFGMFIAWSLISSFGRGFNEIEFVIAFHSSCNIYFPETGSQARRGYLSAFRNSKLANHPVYSEQWAPPRWLVGKSDNVCSNRSAFANRKRYSLRVIRSMAATPSPSFSSNNSGSCTLALS